MSAWSPETDVFQYGAGNSPQGHRSHQTHQTHQTPPSHHQGRPRVPHPDRLSLNFGSPMSPTEEYAQEMSQQAVTYGVSRVDKWEMSAEFAPAIQQPEPPRPAKSSRQTLSDLQSMNFARLKVRRMETVKERLQVETDRNRKTARQAGEALVSFTTSVKDHAVPELWGPLPPEQNPYLIAEEENRRGGCCVIT